MSVTAKSSDYLRQTQITYLNDLLSRDLSDGDKVWNVATLARLGQGRALYDFRKTRFLRLLPKY